MYSTAIFVHKMLYAANRRMYNLPTTHDPFVSSLDWKGGDVPAAAHDQDAMYESELTIDMVSEEEEIVAVYNAM